MQRHPAYTSGVIDVVILEKRDAYLNSAGRIVGFSGGGGATAVTITLVQNKSTGQFRIGSWNALKPLGGIGGWERRLEDR